MTISSATYRNQYVANGSNTVFAYTFKIYDEDDIAVLVDGTLQTITTHYSVSGVSADAGGNITFVTAPANAAIVTIRRNEPLTQQIDYTENDDFPAAAHEEGLDRSVMRDLRQQEELDRCVKLVDGSTVTNMTFDDPADKAGYFPVVNATEDGFNYVNVLSAGELAVSPFIETLLDDANAADARTTLSAAGSGAVTSSGLTMSTARLLGRTTASTGAVEQITVGDGLSLAAGALVAAERNGTTTNDDAAAGKVGEYKSATVLVGAAVSLTTATSKTVTSLSLEAGDWFVQGTVAFSGNAATTITTTSSDVSSTNNTATTHYTHAVGASYTVGTVGVPTSQTRVARFSLASTTTVYLVARADFAVNTLSAYGMIQAWRRR